MVQAFSTSPGYGPVLAEARTVVAEVWGAPNAWRRSCGTRFSDTVQVLTLDPYLYAAPLPSAPARGIQPDSLHAYVSRKLVDRVCAATRHRNLCVDPNATMNIALMEPQAHGADTLLVGLLMHRPNHCGRDGFVAILEFVVVSSNAGWMVRSHKVNVIT